MPQTFHPGPLVRETECLKAAAPHPHVGKKHPAAFNHQQKTIQTAPVLQTQQPVTAVLVGMKAQAFQASMIPLKSAAFKAAPPIKPPSTSTFEKISLALEGLQLPP